MKTGALLRVSLDRVIPNNWNPNKLSNTLYEKLKVGIKHTLAEAGRIPPIVVRPLDNDYQIIDGFHRWRALRDLGEKKISVYVIHVGDATARIMTNTLNYLRGQPDRSQYARGVVELLEMGVSTTDLAELLPESEDDIDLLIEEADVSIKAFEALQKEDGVRSEVDKLSEGEEKDTWVSMKFSVTAEQAVVIEQELGRIASSIKGKNRRARALEYMAIQSSQTALPCTN